MDVRPSRLDSNGRTDQKMHSNYIQTFEQTQPGCTTTDNSTAMKTLPG